MNKDEILEKSRKENKNGDERDVRNKEKSYSISASVATLLCMIMVMIEEGVFNRSATAIWIIYAGVEFTTSLVGAILSKKKWLIGLSIFMGILLVFMVVLYILENSGLIGA